MLHRVFDSRQEADYKEFIEISAEDAAHWLRVAEEFMQGIKALMEENLSE